MLRFSFVQPLALAISLLAPSFAYNIYFESSPECMDYLFFTGQCPHIRGEVTRDDVWLEGSLNQPGTPGTPGAAQQPAPPEAQPPSVPRPTLEEIANGAPVVGGGAETVYSPWEVTVPATIEDLVNFRPVAGVGRMEPNGWTVTGLPANFWVETSSHVQAGKLLGMDASVRFTPVSYLWDYGDGTELRSSTMGASWNSLGTGEFDTTPTAHVYESPGTYTVQLVVEFSPEYKYTDSGWFQMDGVVASSSAQLTVVAAAAATVLVTGPCHSPTSGPGC
jgi:hypothetical protein